MKKVFLVVAIAMSGVALARNVDTTKVNSEANAQGNIKLINDTKEDVRIHTGTGVVNLNSGGGSTSFTCKPGTKVHTAPNGVKKDLIFTVDESMCGKAVKLSQFK